MNRNKFAIFFCCSLVCLHIDYLEFTNQLESNIEKIYLALKFQF